MTKEDRELLLKDLCARLPYGVKIALKNNGTYHHENIAKEGDVTIDKLKGFNGKYFNIYHYNPLDWDLSDDEIEVENIKPYLFPLSSMTEEQRNELYTLIHPLCMLAIDREIGDWEVSGLEIDWYIKNHFDYRGLIDKDLAIDATGLNIY